VYTHTRAICTREGLIVDLASQDRWSSPGWPSNPASQDRHGQWLLRMRVDLRL